MTADLSNKVMRNPSGSPVYAGVNTPLPYRERVGSRLQRFKTVSKDLETCWSTSAKDPTAKDRLKPRVALPLKLPRHLRQALMPTLVTEDLSRHRNPTSSFDWACRRLVLNKKYKTSRMFRPPLPPDIISSTRTLAGAQRCKRCRAVVFQAKRR